ncbi:MAG: response regulator [Syntrophales bacterium LBB04]|nr:response regulator [Syntrophales bacterium LBB04]
MAKILVVDDDKNLKDMLVHWLSEAGFDAAGATNGRSALRLLGEGSFDLMIVDLFMPEMDGLEIIRAIRKTDKTLSIIAISGGGENLGSRNYLQMARQFGATGTLQKPFDLERFLKTVRDCLAGV